MTASDVSTHVRASSWSGRTFAQALTAGAVAGFAFLVVTIVVFPATLMLIWALAVPPRLAKLSGLLLGAGSTVVVVLAVARQACLARGETTLSGCVPPDVTAFFTGGAFFVLVGIPLAALGLSRRKDRES